MQAGKELMDFNEKCRERLSNLEEAKQIEIAKKYYNGKMPWKYIDQKKMAK